MKEKTDEVRRNKARKKKKPKRKLVDPETSEAEEKDRMFSSQHRETISSLEAPPQRQWAWKWMECAIPNYSAKCLCIV